MTDDHFDEWRDLTEAQLREHRPDLVAEIERPLREKIEAHQAQFFRRLDFRIGANNEVYIPPEWPFLDILGR